MRTLTPLLPHLGIDPKAVARLLLPGELEGRLEACADAVAQRLEADGLTTAARQAHPRQFIRSALYLSLKAVVAPLVGSAASITADLLRDRYDDKVVKISKAGVVSAPDTASAVRLVNSALAEVIR